MLFESDEGREAFFRRGRARPGDAIYHASSTNLGIWGDVQSLRADCARILALEIQNRFPGEANPSAGDVLASGRFRNAFDAARRGPTAAVGTMLLGLAQRVGNTELARAAQYDIDRNQPSQVIGDPTELAVAVREDWTRSVRIRTPAYY